MRDSNRIGFIGNPDRLPLGSKDNTGNIVHGYAARSFFKDWVKVGTNCSDENIARVRDSVSHLGFVTATMLHVNRTPKYIASHENVANFIEKLDLPVTTFGFGCQAVLGQSIKNAEVDSRSVRLLKSISDHAKTIAVRGEFTAELCNKYGVKNVEVVGCQSAYFGGVNNWERRDGFFKDFDKNNDKSAAYLSLGPDESKLLGLALKGGSDIVGQGDPTEERISLGSLSREDYLSNEGDVWEPPYLIRAFDEGLIDKGKYFDYIKKKFFKFYNVEDWVKYFSSGYGFCYGTRFHGNMVAFWAGVPALWIAHDMRTLELCQHLRLPYLMHDDLNAISCVEDLYELCDYTDFWKGFEDNLKRFGGYLSRNDVYQFLDDRYSEILSR